MIILYLLVGIICAFVCSSMARSKNREAGLWGVLGFFFGIFAVLVLALLEKRVDNPAMHFQGPHGQPGPGTLTGPAAAPQTSVADEIAQWKRLLDEGAIDEDEFKAKKTELLARR